MADLERLAAVVFEVQGQLQFSARGWSDAERKMWLELAISGSLVLQCQRCLERFDWAFSVANRLLLVPEGEELPEDELQEDDWDAVPVASRADLMSLVEDEVLLALPAAPRHEECDMPSPSDGENGHSPFAALAKLRDGGGA